MNTAGINTTAIIALTDSGILETGGFTRATPGSVAAYNSNISFDGGRLTKSGAGTGYDTVNLINGATLDLSALSESNPYNINLWSLSSIGPDANGSAIDFNNTLNYAWTLSSTGTAITGFGLLALLRRRR